MNTIRRALLVVVPVLLLAVAGTAVAVPPRITWNPNPLVTESIVPGEQATYSVVLKETGILPIFETKQLRIVPEGAIAPYVTVTPPTFPQVFKRGDQVTVQVTVSVPADAPVGVSNGTLVLKRVIGSRVLDVWRAEALPVGVEVVLKDVLGGIIVEDPVGGARYPVNQLILVLVDGATPAEAQELADSVGGRIVKPFSSINAYLIDVPTRTIPELKAVMAKLESDPRVEFTNTDIVPQDYTVPSDIMNLQSYDPLYTKAYDDIFVANAWDLVSYWSVTPKHVNIGIIDTGIDSKHPEFESVDLFGDSADIDTDKEFYHGTGVAGIVGAGNLSATSSLPTNSPQMNGIIAGLPGASYSLGIYLQGRVSQIETAINDAYFTHGVRLFNMSFGWLSSAVIDTSPPEDACPTAAPFKPEKEWQNDRRLFEKIFLSHSDALFIAAAGNTSVPAVFNLPGGGVSSTNVITVAATTSDGSLRWSCFSNRWNENISNEPERPGIDIAAPGENVYVPGSFVEPYDFLDYQLSSGTSMSAPMVTGVVAMMMAVDPSLTPEMIKSILRNTVLTVCLPGQRSGCLINAHQAVQVAILHAISPTKFTKGDLVETSDWVDVWAWDGGGFNRELLGIQPPRAMGTIVGGPEFAGWGWWWAVNFPDGSVDGWVAEEFLRNVLDGPGECGDTKYTCRHGTVINTAVWDNIYYWSCEGVGIGSWTASCSMGGYSEF